MFHRYASRTVDPCTCAKVFVSDVYGIHNKIPFVKKYYIITITIIHIIIHYH